MTTPTNITITKAEQSDLRQIKAGMQEAFQKGFEEKYGKTEETILPEKDIDASLKTKGAVVYKATIEGEIVGGAIVVINSETGHNHLDILYVKHGRQNGGIGKTLWNAIEGYYPNTKTWETCTPYFEKRNIHFYVNICKFHIVEFINERHHSAEEPDDFIGDGNEGMFILQKAINS